MLKDDISPGKLRELQRVEDFIRSHPHSLAADVGKELALHKNTLNGYTILLCRLGRLLKSRPASRVRGSLPATYSAVPGLVPLERARMPVTPQAPVVVGRMELVAALFGPAGRGA
jgi:hypothetical protein